MRKKVITQGLIMLSIIYIICAFTACNRTTRVKDVKPTTKPVAVIINDSNRVAITITDFLQWYKLNYKKANSFPLLGKDGAGNFMVNKTAYMDYLNFLNSSHLLSARYIDYWEIFFVDKATELRNQKIKSDIPDGFDMDLVLITQEPDLILNKIDSIHFNIISMNVSVALVGLRMPSDSTMEYEVEMYKTKGDWQIGYISTPNYD